jgi:Bacterial Ig-like domain (group 3)/Beta-propeller repeat
MPLTWVKNLFRTIRTGSRKTWRLPIAEVLEDRTLLTATSALQQTYGQLPLSFEVNEGQTASQVRFLSHGFGSTLFLTENSAVLSLTSVSPSSVARSPLQNPINSTDNGPSATDGVAIAMNLIGANRNATVAGLDKQAGITNYFIGNDPSQWHTNIPNYSKVEYQSVYPGINLVYYGNQQQLEYDYQLAPGADPSQIRFAVQGAESLALDAQGNLVLNTGIGDVCEHAPVIYQQIAGVQMPVSGQFLLLGNNEVGFQVGAYDASKPLVIDPVLSYSSYLGGNSADEGLAIAVNGSGNAYVTGYTNSTNFPTTTGAFQTSNSGIANVVVTELSSDGTGLVYSTYLGGSGYAYGLGLALDGSGNAYVTGFTESTNFPTTSGAFQTTSNGTYQAFLTKLNASGTGLLYSTYLGGSGFDKAWAIAVDSSGNAYVTGNTTSTNFPTTSGAFQTSHASDSGSTDAFVTKLNASGTALVYSTYLGGNSGDYGNGIAVDASGYAYVTGETLSTNFPTTTGAYQTSHASDSGNYDAFVTKLNASGTGLIYSTYLGGNSGDVGNGIAIDGSGNAYVTGNTNSTNFPTTTGAYQTSSGGDNDAFVTKLNASGTSLIYSTYLGGSNYDGAVGIAIDTSGNAYVTGQTGSTNFPTTSDAFQAALGGVADAFVTELNASGTGLIYSTYLGGSSLDVGQAIAVNSSGNAYITGSTYSTDFPTTTGAFQASHASDGGLLDAFVANFDFLPATTTTLTDNGPNPSIYGQVVSFTVSVSSGGSPISGETVAIEDASNGNAVVASPTLTNGTATFTIFNLTLGTHNLFAVYSGDADNAPSDSSLTPVSQVVNPSGVTLFITDFNGVDEYTTTGTYLGNFVPIGSGGLDINCYSLRFGPNGNLYVCDGAYVKEYDGATGAFLGNFASGLNTAADIIFDGSGNAFVSDYFGNAVYEFSSAGTLLQTFSSGVSTPAGLAFAPNGNLLVANTYVAPFANTITEIDTTTGSYSTFATGLGEPLGLIEGPGGNYYAGNFTYATLAGGTNPDTIQVIPPAGGVSSTWNTGGSYLDGTSYLAFADGDLFATSYYNTQVVRFDGATGAFVNTFTVPSGVYGITARPAGTITTLTDNGPNPSTSGQAVGFTVAVGGGIVNDGETVLIEDASNADAIVASPTLTSGSATFSISNLTVGTHNLFAVYNGDAINAASDSSQMPVSQVVIAPGPAVSAAVINQNISALYNAAGQPFSGAQRSMVNDIVYTFSEPVNILSPADDPTVFTIAVASGWTGTVPTPSWAPVAASNNTQWAITFSGNGVTGGSIANGAYTITISEPSSITAESDGLALSLATSGIDSATQSFFRLFGDINGDEFVNAADNVKFKQGLTTYNAAFDYSQDGFVNAADNVKFKNDLTVNFSGFTATI